MSKDVSNVWVDMINDPFPEWAEDDYLGAALRAGIPFKWLGPCFNCPLLEVCAADECGRLGFSIDVNQSKVK